jgi:hypothetical protein
MQVFMDYQNNCKYPACPPPCDFVDCGAHGTCNPYAQGASLCECIHSYSGANCEVAPHNKAYPIYKQDNAFLVCLASNRAMRCDHGSCSYSDDQGQSWRRLGLNALHTILAAKSDCSVLYGVDDDGYIIKSVDSGRNWLKSLEIELEYLGTAQYDFDWTEHADTAFPAGPADLSEPPVGAALIEAEDGTRWYATANGISAYSSAGDHTNHYFTPWHAEAAVFYAVDCDIECLGVDCGSHGSCSGGLCECDAGYFGNHCGQQ